MLVLVVPAAAGDGRGTRLGGAVLMVVLDGASLTIDSLAAVAEGGDEVVLAPAARERMAAAGRSSRRRCGRRPPSTA